jgi:hypothetical protein
MACILGGCENEKPRVYATSIRGVDTLACKRGHQVLGSGIRPLQVAFGRSAGRHLKLHFIIRTLFLTLDLVLKSEVSRN